MTTRQIWCNTLAKVRSKFRCHVTREMQRWRSENSKSIRLMHLQITQRSDPWHHCHCNVAQFSKLNFSSGEDSSVVSALSWWLTQKNIWIAGGTTWVLQHRRIEKSSSYWLMYSVILRDIFGFGLKDICGLKNTGDITYWQNIFDSCCWLLFLSHPIHPNFLNSLKHVCPDIQRIRISDPVWINVTELVITVCWIIYKEAKETFK